MATIDDEELRLGRAAVLAWSLRWATGKVLLDGKPVSGAQLVFIRVTDGGEQSGRPSQAVTDDKGEFQASTYDSADGIPVGQYVVGVTKQEPVGPLPANFNPEMAAATPHQIRWVIPRKYATPESSGLTIHVTTDGLDPEELQLSTDGAPAEVERVGGKGSLK